MATTTAAATGDTLRTPGLHAVEKNIAEGATTLSQVVEFIQEQLVRHRAQTTASASTGAASDTGASHTRVPGPPLFVGIQGPQGCGA